jgi:hypothetical protein
MTMTNVVLAAVAAVVLGWVLPAVFSLFGIRPDMFFGAVLLFALIWCALSLRDIEGHLRAERDRRSLTLDER